MMQRRFRSVLMVLLTLLALPSFGQDKEQTALVKGRLVSKSTGQPVNEIQVSIPYLKLLATSGSEGQFTFSRVPYGTHTLVVGGLFAAPDSFQIVVNAPVVELTDFAVTPNDASAAAQQAQQIPTIALEESNMSGDDDGVRAQNVSGLLTASRDPFLNTAAFTFGPYRFQPRGYDRNGQQVLINGAVMNDVETGDAYWSQWGGLNDVFRSRSNTYGLQPSEYTFGGPLGSVYFDATAAAQRKQTRVSYSLSNRSYRNRLMFTQSSGLMANGWAYSVSVSKRWATEGYVPGTFYDSYSYYAGVSKRLNGDKHELNLTAFGAPTRRGKVAPAIQEAYDLAGSNYYNPNWGYQTVDGEQVKRNAKVANSFQPVFLFSHEYKPNNRTRVNTAIGYQFGKNGNSTLDWYNAADPRPDYYRYLPSYYAIENPATAAALHNKLAGDPDHEMQLDWDNLYNINYINRETIRNANGIAGNDVTGRRSLYVVANDVDAVKKLTFHTALTHSVSEHLTLNGGIGVISQRTESYRELLDLLGGEFFVNLNQFAARTYVGNAEYIQNDLNNPNGIVKEGDRYNYNYINHFNKAWLWGQAAFTYNKVDFFVSATGGFNNFDREGVFRNGLFPVASYGKSAMQKFTTYGLKGGVTYKLNGRNYLFANGGISQDAPTVDNTFVSPRTRNITVANPTEQKTYTFEGGYLKRAPRLNIRAVGYATDVKDATEIKRFYHDDFQTFVNYTMQDVNMRFIGTELAVEYKVSPALAVTGVAALGQAFYTNRPKVSIYRDNDTNIAVATSDVVYLKDYYLSVGPQSAYTLGLNYRSPKYWYASINLNYFDRNYIEAAPARRTEDAIDLLQPGSAEWNAVIGQERLPSAFTVDVFGGKSFLLSKFSKQLPRNTYLYLNVGISNLLDNKEVRTGGFEQLRYDFVTGRSDKFPPKYFYGFGRNFFVNLSLKF